MTLLVVLGIVVIVTILAALYLSLKSGRGRGGAPGAGGTSAGARQARGGSRSGRSPSLAGRVRSMTGRDEADEFPGRRVAGRSGDDYADYEATRRGARRAGGPDRSGLVTSVAGQRTAGAGPAPGFDETDPAFRAGYGREATGYDGYDAAADTRVSGPPGPEPGTDPFGTGAPTGPRRGYAGDPPGGSRGPDTRRGRYSGSAHDGFETDPAGTVGSGFGAPAPGVPGAPATPGGPARAGHRRRAAAPGGSGPFSPADPGGTGPFSPPGSAGAAGYDEAATAVTDSPFASVPGRNSSPDDTARTGDSSLTGRTGRRRVGKIQKPRLRRAKDDYDNDPWPAADEEDGIPDDKYWEDLYSDKPLSTTARTAQAVGDAEQSWHPGGPADQGSASAARIPDPVPAPVQADGSLLGRGRRARRRQDDVPDGNTEPRPLQQPDPDSASGRRRRGGPAGSPRSAEEDPLTSESFSRHAREASDSRSYRGSRDPNRLPSHGRRESPAAGPASPRPDTCGYGAPGLNGPAGPAGPAGAPGLPGTPGPGQRGTRGTPAGGSVPPGARRDPYGEAAYRNGARSGSPYPEQAGGYPSAGRNGSRPAPPPGTPSGNGRPPASANGQRHGSAPPPGTPSGNGRPPASANGQRHARPALPGGTPRTPGPGGPAAGTNGRRETGDTSYWAPSNGTAGPARSGGPANPLDPAGPAGPAGPTGRPPAYPPNDGTPYRGTSRGTRGRGGSAGTGDYPGSTGGTPYPGDSAGSGEYPQGRRSANRDSRRRPEDGYDDPYGRPDDRRY